MTLNQTLQTNVTKAKELFQKLQDTSDQAVKTRENLFSDLSREVRLHADLDQKELIPALRKNDATKDLATDAAKTNKDLRTKTDELEALPKGSAEFLPKLAEMRKLFDQMVRDERRELIPAVRDNLSPEQVEAVEDKMEARIAAAEEAERAEAEARRQEARRERERTEAVAATKRAAGEIADATKRNVKELRKSAAETVEETSHKITDTSHKIADSVRSGARSIEKKTQQAAENAADKVRRAREDAGESVAAYRETARERGRDVKAVTTAVRAFAGVGKELRSVMMNSLKRSGRDGLETGKRLLREPKKFGEVQRDYITATTRNIMESTQEMLLVVRRASNDARQPVDARLRTAP